VKTRLLWVDLETTGLDSACDYLLEWAMVLTDEDVQVVSEFSQVVHWRNPRSMVRDPSGAGKVVLEMHEESGLFEASEASSFTLEDVRIDAQEWIEQHHATGLYMAGSGVHFDREWLRWQVPRVAKLWHYRNFDLTTLRCFFGEEKAEPVHRALPDLLASIGDLRRYVARTRAAGLF
jgi:oligoribonuclease